MKGGKIPLGIFRFEVDFGYQPLELVSLEYVKVLYTTLCVLLAKKSMEDRMNEFHFSHLFLQSKQQAKSKTNVQLTKMLTWFLH